MSFSKDAFIEGFIAETHEHLNSINESLVLLINNVKDKNVLNSLMRELHTIKGTARMLGFPKIEQLSHGLEDVFNGIRGEKYDLTNNIAQLAFFSLDFISEILAKIKDGQDEPEDISKYLKLYKVASSGIFFTTEEIDKKKKRVAEENKDRVTDNIGKLENITSIRIELSRIDEVVRTFDNLIIRQFRFKHQLEKFEETLSSSNMNGENELPRQLKEDMILTENAIFEVQRQILDLRMLPLDIILKPIRNETEREALKMQKIIELDIPKTDFMLDKTVLEQMSEILLHLVRNSLDHGIEDAEYRKRNGKPERGKISIRASQVSNYLKITVSDDGRGIDYERVRKKAIEMNFSQEKQIMEMSEHELQQFLYQSGLSTKDTVSELSGRGVGLDVVRMDMEKIKGKIHIYSEKNKGTSFELTVPISLATQQGLFVHTNNMKFMIPSQYIVEILDAESANFSSIRGKTFINIRNSLIPVHYIATLLGAETSNTTSTIIVVEHLETQMAIGVDRIEEYSNVVVTPLPPILQNMNSLQGVIYDENYAIIPILNIAEIMQRLNKVVTYDIKRYQSKTGTKVQTILVIDDSTTTRQIEQMIFEKEGYNVEAAKDGLEALEILRVKHVDLIVTDIEMPRMNGNILLENLRRSEEYSKIPVIVVSGAYDKEAKEKFLDAGAQDFIVKSDFQRGNLLQSAKGLLGE